MNTVRDQTIHADLRSIDEERFAKRATAGRTPVLELALAQPAPRPARDVDGLEGIVLQLRRRIDSEFRCLKAENEKLRKRVTLLEEMRRRDKAALESHKTDVASVLAGHEDDAAKLHAEVANLRERLASVERALAERPTP